MDVTERFAAAVAAAPDAVRLDVGAFCIAACAHPGLDVDEGCAALDDLAARAGTDFDSVCAHLFIREGFRGNARDYSDPENSFLDSVLARRLGIPITLSIVTIEVARRVGVEVDGVGMPGHFLVQAAARPDEWCDPFHRGVRYDATQCKELFARVHGDDRGFVPSMLRPTSKPAILARVLTNLEHGRLANDPVQLEWMCRLHQLLPDLSEQEEARLRAAARSARARWN
jgi:regulator of sirC expression with transglutaminase-like and TPR domain